MQCSRSCIYIFTHQIYVFIQNNGIDQIINNIFLHYLSRKIYKFDNSLQVYIIKNYKQMGALMKKILDSFSDMKAKILMLGLDGAGKTTILYQMKLSQTVQSVPTIGFNVEEVNYKGLSFTVWDIGGQTKLRGLWHHYYDNSNAVIYVLDAADEDRFQLAKQTLLSVIQSQNIKDCPVLVFANKMDISRFRPAQLVQKLGLHKMRRQWHLQPCCGINGQGIVEGFQWLKKSVKNSK